MSRSPDPQRGPPPLLITLGTAHAIPLGSPWAQHTRCSPSEDEKPRSLMSALCTPGSRDTRHLLYLLSAHQAAGIQGICYICFLHTRQQEYKASDSDNGGQG